MGPAFQLFSDLCFNHGWMEGMDTSFVEGGMGQRPGGLDLFFFFFFFGILVHTVNRSYEAVWLLRPLQTCSLVSRW